uniref:Phorbol-ester/DAG-type domain-containing protein n=1 Tax=Anopheles quadriannulatus TaxID=34691 RepID=A0A182XEG1_ANOQN
MKCAACKIIAHASCISVLMERSHLQCKPTFRDVGVRQYREQTKTTHHWVHRRTEKGKCKQCGKLAGQQNFILPCAPVAPESFRAAGGTRKADL